MWTLSPTTKRHKEKNLQRFIKNTDAKPQAAQFFPVLTFNSLVREAGPAGNYGAVKT